MSELKRLLEGAGLDGWRVSETATESYELFFVHKSLETVRATDTVTTQVTVYVDHDGKRGDSTFSVYGSMTTDDLKKKIQAAADRARLVFNEPYELPQGGTLEVSLPTNMDTADMKQLGRQIADAVFAADTVEGGSINACEIFLYRDTVRVQNSRGIDKKQHVCRVMIEAIPTFTTEKESVELYEDHRFTSFEPEKVTAEIARRMREVRDRSLAVKPRTPLTVNVLLRPQEIRSLLTDLAYDANYSAVYSHANLHKVGDDLQAGGDGDKLTFILKAILPGCEKSSYFDGDGMALTDTCILQDGVVKNNYGSSRFGQYLGVKEISGDLPMNVSLAAGTLTKEEIQAAPYIEAASLSGLQVDLYNDYIGGEIRLAYYFDGQETRPVIGITMSAKLSDVLRHLRLTANICAEGAYEGPERLMMRNVAIL
ncbi:MAG: hypothetical protein IJ664_06100 [Clostridia bacterium]|nr:hypothetical protein [Clostridia bacterium]